VPARLQWWIPNGDGFGNHGIDIAGHDDEGLLPRIDSETREMRQPPAGRFRSQATSPRKKLFHVGYPGKVLGISGCRKIERIAGIRPPEIQLLNAGRLTVSSQNPREKAGPYEGGGGCFDKLPPG